MRAPTNHQSRKGEKALLKITTPTQEHKTPHIRSILTAAILFIGILGALFSMLKISGLPQAFSIAPPLESFQILLNHLFTISEQHQAYLYQRFTVSVPPENYANYIFVALGIIAALLAAYIFIMQKRQSRIMCVIIFLLFTALQIYFGVFAAPIWNITLYAAIAWFLLRNANIAAFVGVSAAVIFAAMVFYPGPSPFLTQLSETIRDQFGERLERSVVMEASPQQDTLTAQQAQELEMREEAAGQGNDLQGGQAYGIDRDERFAGSQIGAAVGQRIWLLWLIGLAFVVGFILWFFVKLKDAYKRRAVFNSPDCAAAIDSMFKHLVAWLVEFGVDPQNDAYAEYVSQFDAILPGQYAQNYLEAVELWQETVYSSHTMTERDKKRMRSFLDDTRNTLAKGVNPFARARVRVRLLLRNEVRNAEI